MTEGILDFLVMVLVLGIVLAVAFGLILPLIDGDLMHTNDTIDDKAMTKSINADIDYVNYSSIEEELIAKEPKYSAAEIVLLTQVQDENMVLPRTFKLEDGTIIDVESTYKLVIRDVGITIGRKLPLSTGQYTINYDYNSPEAFLIEQYIEP